MISGKPGRCGAHAVQIFGTEEPQPTVVINCFFRETAKVTGHPKGELYGFSPVNVLPSLCPLSRQLIGQFLQRSYLAKPAKLLRPPRPSSSIRPECVAHICRRVRFESIIFGYNCRSIPSILYDEREFGSSRYRGDFPRAVAVPGPAFRDVS